MDVKLLVDATELFSGKLSDVNKHISDFLRNNSDGIVISFVDVLPPLFENNDRCLMWRSSFDYEIINAINYKAYQDVDLFYSDSHPYLSKCADAFYHDYAIILFKLLVYEKCRADFSNKVLFIAPLFFSGENKDKYSIFNTKYNIKILSTNIKILATNIKKIYLNIAYFILLIPKFLIRKCIGILWDIPIFYLNKYKNFKKKNDRVLKNILSNNEKNDNIIVITLEDSGSFVNLNPAIYIIKKIRRDINIVILTSSDFVREEIEHKFKNLTVFNVNDISLGGYFYHDFFKNLNFKFKSKIKTFPTFYSDDFILEVRSRNTHYQRFLYRCDSALDLLQENLNVKLVFSIYEVLPIAVSAGKWAKRRSISWLGFFPILSGDRPDGYYFPADRHLVYGQQLQDIISTVKTDADIDVVGSPTYDVFIGRNKVEDTALVNGFFPAKGNKKLVVVATEAFSDPLTEMAPVLRSLSKMENVFVVVKVHPKDSVGYFRAVSTEIDENIQVVGIFDLGALLNSSDLLICVLSNLIISAAILGTPVLSCDFSGKRKVIDFVKEGLCFGCDKVEDVDSMIGDLLRLGKESSVVKQKLKQGIVRFNGPNDGQSHSRIKDILLEYL